ncbi:hypothetical protein Nmel_009920, partial [Mimus melanotis]
QTLRGFRPCPHRRRQAAREGWEILAPGAGPSPATPGAGPAVPSPRSPPPPPPAPATASPAPQQGARPLGHAPRKKPRADWPLSAVLLLPPGPLARAGGAAPSTGPAPLSCGGSAAGGSGPGSGSVASVSAPGQREEPERKLPGACVTGPCFLWRLVLAWVPVPGGGRVLSRVAERAGTVSGAGTGTGTGRAAATGVSVCGQGRWRQDGSGGGCHSGLCPRRPAPSDLWAQLVLVLLSENPRLVLQRSPLAAACA